jgi:hypothetical protein
VSFSARALANVEEISAAAYEQMRARATPHLSNIVMRRVVIRVRGESRPKAPQGAAFAEVGEELSVTRKTRTFCGMGKGDVV